MSVRRDRVSLPTGIKLLAAAMFLWGFGYGLHAYMFPVHLRNIGCTPTQVGMVFSISMAAMALSAIPGGWLADRFDRRRVMLFSWLLGVPSAILYYLATDYRLAALGIVLYSSSQVGYPALNAYAISCAPEGGSGTTFGIINAGFAAGMVISPLIGGWMAERWSAGNVFLLSSAFFFAAAVIIAFLPDTASRAEGPAENSYGSLLRDGKFVRFIVLYSMCAFGFYMIQPLIAQFLSDMRQGSIEAVGMLGTLMSLGQVLITGAVGKVADRKGAIVAVAVNLLVFVASMICFISTSSLWLTFACMFLLGGFMAGQGVVYAGVGEILGHRADGKAFALFSLAMSGASVAGPYLGGALYTNTPATPFYVSAALITIGSCVLIRLGQMIRCAAGGEGEQRALSDTN